MCIDIYYLPMYASTICVSLIYVSIILPICLSRTPLSFVYVPLTLYVYVCLSTCHPSLYHLFVCLCIYLSAISLSAEHFSLSLSSISSYNKDKGKTWFFLKARSKSEDVFSLLAFGTTLKALDRILWQEKSIKDTDIWRGSNKTVIIHK